jgi:hypothetical protein
MVLATISSYTHKGCYNETTGRTLNATSLTSSTMTVEVCASFCSAYAYFGVEYGTQCYCGPYPRPGSGLVPAQTDCNMKCAGSSSQLCGAGNRLNLYYSADGAKSSADTYSPASVGRYRYFNCVVDSPRVLSVNNAADNMTVESCISMADAGGYQWAGLEYGRECWLGRNVLSAVQNATSSQCNMVCKGNVTEYCGAGSRLSLYQLVWYEEIRRDFACFLFFSSTFS